MTLYKSREFDVCEVIVTELEIVLMDAKASP